MQFKPLPDPAIDGDPIETVDAVRRALPSTPDPTLDCCGRVMAEAGVDTRDDAADWLVFCRALGLADEEADGYRRTARASPLDRSALASAFRERVLGADAVVASVESAAAPRTPADVFARLDDAGEIPRSARRRHGDRLEARWTDRVRRLLDWAVAFGLVERTDDGYRA